MSTVPAAGPPGAVAAAPPPDELSPAGRRSRRWTAPAAFAAAGVILFALYYLQARTVPDNSDGATNALQAWDMLHGNVLLRGWTVSDVSFYTTELPQYVVLEAIRGLSAGLVPIAGAMNYTLVVLLAALLAKGKATGREGALRALVAGGIMLAPSLGFGSLALLANPDHLGTQILLLATWLIVDRAPERWWVPVVVGLLLTWEQIADPLVLYEGVAPLLLVCGARAGGRRGPLRERWYDVSLAVAALASAGIAEFSLKLIHAAGGFVTTPVATGLAHFGTLWLQMWVSLQSVLVLFGADFFGMQLRLGALTAFVHLAGVALAAWAVAVAVRRLRRMDRVVQVLVVALGILLLAYTFGTWGRHLYNVHEIVGVLPIGAVLAGRLLAGRLRRAGLLPALAVVLACYGLILARDASHHPAYGPRQQVATWLAEHHFSYGLAGYQYASSVTVDSGGRVDVRPIARQGQGLVLDLWEAQVSWYDAHLHDASFVIVPQKAGACYTLACLRQAPQAVYGKPAAIYRVGDLEVLVWRKNLLGTPLRQIPPQVP
jgi:hypothetical protein